MPKVVDHEKRRQELAAAVWEVAAKGGLESVTLRSVAAASGHSTGVASHYFADKAQLLIFAFLAAVDQVRQRLQPVLEHPSAAALTQAVLETLPLDETRTREWHIWFTFAAQAAFDPRLAEEMERHYAQWIVAVEEVVQAVMPDAHPDEYRRRARLLIATVEGLSLMSTYRQLAIDELAHLGQCAVSSALR